MDKPYVLVVTDYVKLLDYILISSVCLPCIDLNNCVVYNVVYNVLFAPIFMHCTSIACFNLLLYLYLYQYGK